MVLPFIAVFTKPFFCALADRHRRYRLYFILALLFTLIGFGSYTFLPFFPQFIGQHGRLAWYLLVVATVVGYIAYGVVWSLGDAYAANVSHRTGESFGLIRLWGTIGWGVAGALVGALSPYLQLPEMVLGFLIFIFSHIFEILLLIWWPNGSDFEMGDQPACEHTNIPPPRPPTTKVGVADCPHPKFAEPQLVCGAGEATLTEKPPLEAPSQTHGQVTHGQVLHEPPHFKLGAKQLEEAHRAESERLELERRQVGQLQMTIFKLVARKHKSLLKYLIIFVALGAVYNIHWSYFFLHLDQLAAEGKGADFSTLVGMCLVAQAVGETFCFAIAPWVVSKLGRDGAISLNAMAYAVRYYGNGLGIPLVSPYVAVLTESLQGINYGIFYYLITDTALHFALLVDDVIPELQASGQLPKGANLELVRTSLRATMQGVFSGAFDGLGFGLGSLIAGLVLERHSYEQLWCYTATGAVLLFVLHALYECTNRLVRRKHNHSYERRLKALQCSQTAKTVVSP